MTILGFMGDMGSGKTLSMIRYAVNYFNEGHKIYSNVDLKGVKFTPYTLNDLMSYADNRSNFDKAVILLDEAHIFIDSRTSAMKRNRILSYFLLQTRKKSVILMYTTQYAHQIDKRLRSTTDIIIQCSTKKRKIFNGTNELYTMNTLNLFKSNGSVMTKKIIFKSSDYYKYYDTNQVIRNIGDI